MPVETVYADLVLAVAALVAAILYLRARRRHVRRKKAGPPVRPATPVPMSAGPTDPSVTTWAPPPVATHAANVAPTVVAPLSPSWDQPPVRGAAPGWGPGTPAAPGPPPAPPPPPFAAPPPPPPPPPALAPPPPPVPPPPPPPPPPPSRPP